MKAAAIRDLLSRFTIFKELDEYELEKISDISLTREFKKGAHVFMQGEPLKNVYFVYRGKIKIYKSDSSGKEQIVSIQKKGDMFPHVGFFRRGDYPAFAEVLDPATLVIVPIANFEKVLIDNPELSIKLFKVLGERIVDLQNRLEEQILNNTNEQIIKLLVRLGKTHGTEQPDGRILLKAEFTNRDLANMIGTTRETVSRTLTRMKKEQLIEVDEKGNILFDPEDMLEEIF
ncbi:Crp/Fnr family transcriptional regulator [Neobacillus notoginsengisoli]|uniref:Crp/Fnr family transcriptional regulator n=1 Tax=Neobacillus notoginsengisoli TaxID=1578198 RepID=A0A417YVF7_9BACI|nr:Crp/Fnr family transcriptional regulator [Neobacillus notoginsengisoli]RHW41293.1 Crp/Fnr family transcriptional regulator [Neobacillus notoginsengisoli]